MIDPSSPTHLAVAAGAIGAAVLASALIGRDVKRNSPKPDCCHECFHELGVHAPHTTPSTPPENP